MAPDQLQPAEDVDPYPAASATPLRQQSWLPILPRLDPYYPAAKASCVSAVLTGSFGPYLPDATGPHEVVVEFSAEKAHLVSSREWHPTQTVTALTDGRVRIVFVAPNLAPIVSWVLEWGAHARAIAPAALVEQVTRELDAARAQYGAAGSLVPSISG